MSKTESLLVQALAITLSISIDGISPTKTFEEYGLNSLDAVRFLMDLEGLGGPEIEAETLYEHTSIRALAEFIDRGGVTAGQALAAG